MFAYEDGMGKYQPRAESRVDKQFNLPNSIWLEKRRLITEVYGFGGESWEARTAPRLEAFHCFQDSLKAAEYISICERIP